MGTLFFVRLLAYAILPITMLQISADQPKQIFSLTEKEVDSLCISPLEIKSPALLNELNRFMARIDGSELPILALETKGDSSFCYVSALMSTYVIQRNPPTAVVKVLNREALLYTGTESVARLSTNCQQDLIRKYLTILHVDKVNKKMGQPAGSEGGFTYDPVLVKISMKGAKVVGVTNPEMFPFFTY